MVDPYHIAVIGTGQRGLSLARAFTADPARSTLVAAAEPKADRRAECQRELGLSAEQVYTDHTAMLNQGPKLDAVIVATDPATHRQVACACMDRGLPIFLEKPMADTIENARAIADTADRTRATVQVGFNLRYAPFYEQLHEIVTAGTLGQVLAINWTEAPSLRMWVDDYCRSPSYNRREVIGSWLLEKSCHDIDLFNWLLGNPCLRVSSFGSRRYFVPRDDVPQHCSHGCPISDECLYYAPKQEAVHRLSAEESDICVYNCGSDLVDRQATVFEYEDGAVVTFNLLPVDGGRYMHIAGTEATLFGKDSTNEILVRSMRTGEMTTWHPDEGQGGHGGADVRMPRAFFDYLDDRDRTPKTAVREGFEAVLMGCAADMAMRKRRVVELEPLRRYPSS